MKFNTQTALFAVLLLTASTGFGAPSMKVTVFDGSGKVAFKGATGDESTFATGALQPGQYIVQFNSATSAVNGQQFGLVISAGSKKVVADSVAGEKFLVGGVAMRIVVGSGSKITGHIGPGLTVRVDPTTGKKLVWVPKKLGSNLPAHWALEDSAEAKEAMTASSFSIKNLQDKQAQGVGLR